MQSFLSLGNKPCFCNNLNVCFLLSFRLYIDFRCPRAILLETASGSLVLESLPSEKILTPKSTYSKTSLSLSREKTLQPIEFVPKSSPRRQFKLFIHSPFVLFENLNYFKIIPLILSIFKRFDISCFYRYYISN